MKNFSILFGISLVFLANACSKEIFKRGVGQSASSLASGLSFADEDYVKKSVRGSIKFSAASDESLLSSYELYWSNADQSNLTKIGSVTKGDATKYDIASSVTLNDDVKLLVIKSVVDGVESETAVSVDVVDKFYPTNLSNSSVDSDGLDVNGSSLSGSLSLAGLDSSDATEFAIYWGSAEDSKLDGSTLIASFTKTGATVSYNFGTSVSIPTGATHILIYSVNADVEAAVPASIALSNIGTKAQRMTAFSAASATSGAQGDILLTLDFPTQTSRYKTVDIRRLAGSTAPNVDCTSNGTVVTTFTSFSDTTYVDSTGGANGAAYSYRACITSQTNELTADDTVTAIKGRDTVAPTALSAFGATTGTVTDGDIALTWTYPGDKSDYGQMVIRRLAGATAPNANCSSNGTVALTLTTFASTSYTDATGSTSGASFSYRVCIYDTTGNLMSTNTAQNIAARDTQGPTALGTFSGATGTATDGDIRITINFPTDTSDYSSVDIRRIAGSTAPNSDCSSDGSVIQTISSFSNQVVTDATGSTTGGLYSYRACVYDSNSNLTSTNTIVGVRARDTQAPAAAASFSASAGSGSGEVSLSWTLPASVTDIASIQVRKLAGTTAPNADCTSNGTQVGSTYTSFTANATVNLTDTGMSAGAAYSYRLCVTDSSGNLTSSNNQANVAAGSGFQTIFITSTTHNGNFGGLSGADAYCQTAATNAGLGGTWKALLSVWGITKASDRLSVTLPVYNTRPAGSGGPQLVASAGSFWSAPHSAAINFTETGGAPPTGQAWTSTISNGNWVGAQADCNEWTQVGHPTNHSAYYGLSSVTSGSWASDDYNNCGGSASLYCINGQ